MKNPKIDERVVVYDGGKRVLGTITSISQPTWFAGPIAVRLDNPHGDANKTEIYVHPKQCRRLKRKVKRRREVWISEDDGYLQFSWREEPDYNMSPSWVKFVEVGK